VALSHDRTRGQRDDAALRGGTVAPTRGRSAQPTYDRLSR
jgi:hypothetical protein